MLSAMVRMGEGVEQVYDKALAGDDTVSQLADYITKTMPEGAPEECAGEDALAVATWLHHAFYSEAARLRNRPARVMLVHLTGNQLEQSLADLYGYFGGTVPARSNGDLKPNIILACQEKRKPENGSPRSRH
ncbi:MAG: hypothetical protein R3C11_24195 [Planctomycetaceae bacterium]